MGLTQATVGGKAAASTINGIESFVAPLGLSLVLPTSVAVGSGSYTLSTLGQVTFTSVSSVSLNGCFTSAYNNYIVVWDTPTRTAVDGSMRLRASGTDNATAAAYGTQRTWGTGSTNTVANTSSTSWLIDTASAGATLGASGQLNLYGPALAVNTHGLLTWYNASSTTTMYNGSASIIHNSATVFDGFSLIPSSSTYSGSVRVYGYNG